MSTIKQMQFSREGVHYQEIFKKSIKKKEIIKIKKIKSIRKAAIGKILALFYSRAPNYSHYSFVLAGVLLLKSWRQHADERTKLAQNISQHEKLHV